MSKAARTQSLHGDLKEKGGGSGNGGCCVVLRVKREKEGTNM